jgi:hypothetical protein
LVFRVQMIGFVVANGDAADDAVERRWWRNFLLSWKKINFYLILTYLNV